MGQVLGGICECGYKGSATLGAGRSNFQEVCRFPHYCRKCENLISVDIFKKDNTCPDCGSDDIHTYEASTNSPKYKIIEKLSDERLRSFGFHRSDDEQFSWYGNTKSHVILRGGHHCPKCHNNSLRFFTELMFD